MSDKEFEYLLKNEGNIWEKYIKGEVELESGEIKLSTKLRLIVGRCQLLYS